MEAGGRAQSSQRPQTGTPAGAWTAAETSQTPNQVRSTYHHSAIYLPTYLHVVVGEAPHKEEK